MQSFQNDADTQLISDIFYNYFHLSITETNSNIQDYMYHYWDDQSWGALFFFLLPLPPQWARRMGEVKRSYTRELHNGFKVHCCMKWYFPSLKKSELHDPISSIKTLCWGVNGTCDSVKCLASGFSVSASKGGILDNPHIDWYTRLIFESTLNRSYIDILITNKWHWLILQFRLCFSHLHILIKQRSLRFFIRPSTISNHIFNLSLVSRHMKYRTKLVMLCILKCIEYTCSTCTQAGHLPDVPNHL